MKKIAYAAFTSAAALALAACGGSETATEEAGTENVETMAEEAAPVDPIAEEGLATEAPVDGETPAAEATEAPTEEAM